MEDELKRNSIVQMKNGDYMIQKIIIEITFILKKNEGYIYVQPSVKSKVLYVRT